MLDSLRKELLNLTLSNGLLKLREFKAKGLTVRETTAEVVLQKLVEESKKCVFLPAGAEETPSRAVFYLKTNYAEKELEHRIFKTFTEAKSFIEERGINALFLALGALKWFEDDNSDLEILSPLLLLPVQIVRSVVQGETTFELKYNGEAIESNYTLERKMEVEYGIKLPVFDENNKISDYFQAIEDTVKNKKKWAVLPNEVRVNLFSFLKLMMYHDLDDARWSEEHQPSKHGLIKNLLDNFGNLLSLDSSDEPNQYFQLDTVPISEIDHILDADNSQAEAIDRVFRHKYLVIKGPPGTGKSQTISNIIASCIKKGKSVLFVSEKMAALEVVKNRLEKSGLGAACLELHSYKANRAEVLQSVRHTMELKTQKNVRDNGELLRLEETRQQLNDYYTALLEPINNSDITPFYAIGEILKMKQEQAEIPFLTATNTQWTRAEIRQRADSIKSAAEFIVHNGQQRTSPFYGVGRMQIGLFEIDTLKAQIIDVKNNLQKTVEYAKNLAEKLELPHPTTLNGIKQLLNTAKLLLDCPELLGINRDFNDKIISHEETKELFELGQKFHNLKKDYADKLLNDAHHQNFHLAKIAYQTKGEKWYKFVYSDFRAAQKQLFSVLKINPSSIEEQLALINVLVEKAELIEKAKALKSIVKELFTEGGDWDFENDEKWLKRQSGVDYIFEMRKMRKEGKLYASFFEKLDIDSEVFNKETDRLQAKLTAFERKLEKLMSVLEFEPKLKNSYWADSVLTANMEMRLELMSEKFDLLPVYCQWNAHKKQLEELGCSKVTDKLLKTEAEEIDKVHASWWYSVLTSLLDEAFKTRPALNQLQLSHQVGVFKETDAYLIAHYNRLKIKYEHLGRIPNLQTVGQPMSVLRNELSKQRRHLPLRTLLEQAGEIIVQIKPVFMMSPLSVAQFLKPEKIKFDYIIFDEASQVKPVEAFGALLRGDNVVIVGDDKQLPPSDFFTQIADNEDVDDENEQMVVDDMESILDLFVTKNAKQTMLQWHYRSKHESLIAVSNKHFYEDKLINLPSALADSVALGLQFRHLPDTQYASGKNEKEAVYIIEALREHAKNYPNPDDCSIGIVAFGIRQKDCIETLLMSVRKEDVDFDRYISAAESAKEPFFIKNLENVQGDERDVMFVSICYGKNPEGKLYKKFGPINRKGGERRLNVLFTRARLRCVLFSNFTATDMKVEDHEAMGLKVFKAFLDYAQNRSFSRKEHLNSAVESPFESVVKSALEKEGFEVHSQIGSAGYFVDLAISHPEQKGRYMLGIECDGVTFNSSRSIRERDRLRQVVLEGLGWQIYRIWSADWFRQPALELKKLLDFIAVIKSGVVIEMPETPSVITPVLEQKDDSEYNWKEKYKQATVDLSSITQELHLVDDNKLATIIVQILEVESPIHQDFLKTIIAQQLDIGRTSALVNKKFLKIFNLGAKRGDWLIRDKFLWRTNHALEKARDRSRLSEKLRRIDWVAPEEIQLTIKTIVSEARTIDKVELMKLTLHTLNGGTRLTESAKAVLDKELNEWALAQVVSVYDKMVKINQ